MSAPALPPEMQDAIDRSIDVERSSGSLDAVRAGVASRRRARRMRRGSAGVLVLAVLGGAVWMVVADDEASSPDVTTVPDTESRNPEEPTPSDADLDERVPLPDGDALSVGAHAALVDTLTTGEVVDGVALATALGEDRAARGPIAVEVSRPGQGTTSLVAHDATGILVSGGGGADGHAVDGLSMSLNPPADGESLRTWAAVSDKDPEDAMPNGPNTGRWLVVDPGEWVSRFGTTNVEVRFGGRVAEANRPTVRYELRYPADGINGWYDGWRLDVDVETGEVVSYEIPAAGGLVSEADVALAVDPPPAPVADLIREVVLPEGTEVEYYDTRRPGVPSHPFVAPPGGVTVAETVSIGREATF